jgi:phosphoglycolate phosphatase
VRCAIFDWDGTLADSHRSLYEANAAVMRAFDLPFSPALYRRHYAPNWRVMYERLGVPGERIDEANVIWEAAFHNGARNALLPGALDAIERLETAGIATALVTAGPRAIVEPQMTRLGFAARIRIRVFGDDQPEQKPDPAPLRRALRALAVEDPRDATYLGDAPDDMRMAVVAGTHAIGIVSVLSDEAMLRDAGADAVYPTVADWVDDLLAVAAAPGAS